MYLNHEKTLTSLAEGDTTAVLFNSVVYFRTVFTEAVHLHQVVGIHSHIKKVPISPIDLEPAEDRRKRNLMCDNGRSIYLLGVFTHSHSF